MVKPLDLGSLVDSGDVFVALEGIVEDLQAWLQCVEEGMDELLKVSVVSGEASGVEATTT